MTIWCDLALPAPALAALRGGAGAHPLTFASEGAALEDADVAFGHPDAGRSAGAAGLRWVQLSAAGYTAFDRAPIRTALSARGACVTNASSVFSEPCAQHALAFLLADARQLARSMRHQLGDRAWTSKPTRAASTLLGEQTMVVVAGFGAIGRRLAELLAPFHVQVVGLRRVPRADDPVPTYPLSAADPWLGRADYVVDVLPASDDTARFFDAARLAAFRRGAVFINIGRGSTVDQGALAAALGSGHLRAAYLDVTDPEPPPPDDPLWSLPSCVITPHSAGGHATEWERLVALFLGNLRRFETGQPLVDRVI